MFLALFIQTTVFVIFNKVVTAQYFLWYMTLLPLIFVNTDLGKRKLLSVGMLAMFLFLDMLWCQQSYRFEFLGEHTISQIQYVNIAWFVYCCFTLAQIILNHRVTITKEIGVVVDEAK